MDAVLRVEAYHCPMVNTSMRVTITVSQNYSTSMDFTLYGMPYTLTVTAWQSRGLAKFLGLFHAHAPRDIATYGEIIVDSEGTADFRMNVLQKENAVLQASKDIMTCLNTITQHYQSSVLDYATWYCEWHGEENSYSQYITRRTSQCIKCAEFVAPNVAWKLVVFS